MIITYLKENNVLWTLCFSQTVILICSKSIYVFMFCKLFLLFTYWRRCNFKDFSLEFCQLVNVSYRNFFSWQLNIKILGLANSFFRSINMKYYLEVLSINVGCRFYWKMQIITPQSAKQNRSKRRCQYMQNIISCSSFFVTYVYFYASFHTLIWSLTYSDCICPGYLLSQEPPKRRIAMVPVFFPNEYLQKAPIR